MLRTIFGHNAEMLNCIFGVQIFDHMMQSFLRIRRMNEFMYFGVNEIKFSFKDNILQSLKIL